MLINRNNSKDQQVFHLQVCFKTQNFQKKIFLGLRAVGINCESPNKIKLTDCIHSEVDKLQFVWTLEKQKEKEVVSVPVYLYSNRAQFLFELYFVPVNFDKALLSQRGVALLTNSSF